MIAPLSIFSLFAIISARPQEKRTEPTDTKVTIYGTLTCVGMNWWCYTISVYEEDTWPIFNRKYDDLIGRHGYVCATRNTSDYIVEGYLKSDGIFNNQYEISVFVVHSCTPTVYMLQLQRPTRTYNISDVEGGEIREKYDLSLDTLRNYSTKTYEWFP